MYPGQLDSTQSEWNPPDYPLRFLAEGDSWFSFGSLKLHSLLTQLRLDRQAAVLSLAQPGDTIRRMSDISRNPELDHWLSLGWGAFNWNAVLVSGGGNDLIDDAGKIIPPSTTPQPGNQPVQAYLDPGQLAATLADVADGYRRIVALRDRPDSPCPGVPLITHEYDWTTPRDAPAHFLMVQQGPWLYPALQDAQIPPHRWDEISDHLLGALGQCLRALESELPNFFVTQTQGTLTRAAPGTAGKSNDWANEIHPNGAGFRKLASRLAALIDGATA